MDKEEILSEFLDKLTCAQRNMWEEWRDMGIQEDVDIWQFLIDDREDEDNKDVIELMEKQRENVDSYWNFISGGNSGEI